MPNHVFIMSSGNTLLDHLVRTALVKDKRFETWLVETADDLATRAYACAKDNERFMVVVPCFTETEGTRKYLDIRIRKCTQRNAYISHPPLCEPFNSALMDRAVKTIIATIDHELSVSGIFAREHA